MKRFYKLFSSVIVLVLTIGAGLSALVPVTNAAQVPAKLSDYQNHPHRDAIDYVVKNKLMWLFPDGSFQPDKPITQADLVAGLVNVKGLTSGEPVQELPENHWAKVYYERAKRDGILDGVEINPNKVMNREEASRLMVNAWKSLFPRYPWKQQYNIIYSVGSNWIAGKPGKFPNGVSTTLYDSFGTVSRGEQAFALQSLHREYQGIQEAEKIATQFHNSLKISGETIRGALPTVKGYDTRLYVRFKNGKTDTIDSGKFSFSTSQVEYVRFLVKFKGEAESLANYLYGKLPTLERENSR
ncbi:S-layer homology domain-containing protein [Brevibacillus borstelensis]|uniref:SLH domain-containing protein n=1 Tax=Brevibacillus borstelensis AK1 TaxID=1300222 RepID=M8DFZ7_9BACL|nr:S-layer homology domain-containing protein [Brevibacillus borstelensis]EMT52388.1 hypothetical protein I532_12064 [Brevibacillus borstelensis AK1]